VASSAKAGLATRRTTARVRIHGTPRTGRRFISFLTIPVSLTRSESPMRHAFVFVCALIIGCAGFAAEWPQFRGPTAQGLYDGTPRRTEWGKSQNIAWRKPVAGLGWSSPVIAGGRVYLTTAVPDGHNQSLRAICLDAAKGSVIWDKQVFHQDGRT